MRLSPNGNIKPPFLLDSKLILVKQLEKEFFHLSDLTKCAGLDPGLKHSHTDPRYHIRVNLTQKQFSIMKLEKGDMKDLSQITKLGSENHRVECRMKKAHRVNLTSPKLAS